MRLMAKMRAVTYWPELFPCQLGIAGAEPASCQTGQTAYKIPPGSTFGTVWAAECLDWRSNAPVPPSAGARTGIASPRKLPDAPGEEPDRVLLSHPADRPPASSSEQGRSRLPRNSIVAGSQTRGHGTCQYPDPAE